MWDQMGRGPGQPPEVRDRGRQAELVSGAQQQSSLLPPTLDPHPALPWGHTARLGAPGLQGGIFSRPLQIEANLDNKRSCSGS